MIKHSIRALSPPIKKESTVSGKIKKRYRAGSNEHLQAILDGQVKRNPFKVGDTVWITEYSEVGEVQNIYTKASQAVWQEYKPEFIEVWVENWQCSVPLHNSDLDWIQ